MTDETEPPWLTTEEYNDGQENQAKAQRLLMKHDDWLGIARPKYRTILTAGSVCHVE